MKKIINNISNFISKLSKKTKITILVITLSILSITVLYQTFAINSTVSGIEDNYIITLNNNSTINIPAGSSKTIYLEIINSNKGTLNYGVIYKGTNIKVEEYIDSENPSTGTINKEEIKLVKLYITNSGTSDSDATISPLFGYENGGELIIPSEYTLVTEISKWPINLATYINNSYTSASKTQVANNNINYNYASSVNLMEDIKGNIRYYGASPNNYIYFNCSDYSNQTSDTCELWRIIGVFNNQVKLIRNDPMGEDSITYSFSWDNKNTSTGAETNYGKNDWTTARLMKLLNPSNYFTIDTNDNGNGQSLYWNSKSGTCFKDDDNGTFPCNFTSTGIKNDTTRNKIAEYTYNIGGWSSSSVYPDFIYEKERGTTVYTGRPTIWTGKIALMHPSDYAYAADLSKCKDENGNDLNLDSYNSNVNNYQCRSNNYLYKNSSEWLMNTNSDNQNLVWTISSGGNITGGSGSSFLQVRPVLFLTKAQKIKSGSGTQENPYKLQE